MEGININALYETLFKTIVLVGAGYIIFLLFVERYFKIEKISAHQKVSRLIALVIAIGALISDISYPGATFAVISIAGYVLYLAISWPTSVSGYVQKESLLSMIALRGNDAEYPAEETDRKLVLAREVLTCIQYFYVFYLAVVIIL